MVYVKPRPSPGSFFLSSSTCTVFHCGFIVAAVMIPLLADLRACREIMTAAMINPQ
jgi:hypothetical protein